MRLTCWLVGGAALVVVGCAPATRVVLLPQAGGATGSVEVSTTGASAVLSQAYESATADGDGVSITQTSQAQVQVRYRELLAAAPPAPDRFTLFYEAGGTRLTPASAAELDKVLEQATTRVGAEIVIIGHTDTVGSHQLNDRLSLERARMLESMLVERGFDPARVLVRGQGKREPLVGTADKVAEPRNRRVEIMVR